MKAMSSPSVCRARRAAGGLGSMPLAALHQLGHGTGDAEQESAGVRSGAAGRDESWSSWAAEEGAEQARGLVAFELSTAARAVLAVGWWDVVGPFTGVVVDGLAAQLAWDGW